jgi:hypothetical protein
METEQSTGEGREEYGLDKFLFVRETRLRRPGGVCSDVASPRSPGAVPFNLGGEDLLECGHRLEPSHWQRIVAQEATVG